GGAIMVLSDGVIGLDGTTGTEQWRYRSPDDSLVRAEATPEGSTVVLTYRGKDEGELDVVVLEAATGELRGQYPASADGGPNNDADGRGAFGPPRRGILRGGG